jgi:hypothetical protein
MGHMIFRQKNARFWAHVYELRKNICKTSGFSSRLSLAKNYETFKKAKGMDSQWELARVAQKGNSKVLGISGLPKAESLCLNARKVEDPFRHIGFLR